MDAINEEPASDVVADARGRFGTRWWLATAATLFFACGVRELTMHVARERIATRDAEIRRLTAENAMWRSATRS